MRLSPSDVIIHDLLEPASRSLRERSLAAGPIAGKVFYEYASFCTSQLEDQYAIADIKRMENLHRSKHQEALQYLEVVRKAMQRNDQNAAKRYKKDYERAEKLEKMDNVELDRLLDLQRTFLEKAIENFLKCFAACTDFDHHVPKFCALWLKHSKQRGVNTAVAHGLQFVPSYKFLSLLHQLCSRLSDEAGEFQTNLSQLLSRTLNDHPFHAVHQIYSTISSVGDATALSRSFAAKKLTDCLGFEHKIGEVFVRDIAFRLESQFSMYSDLASTPIDKKAHPSNEFLFSSYPTLRAFRSKTLAEASLPPPSMRITVSPDRDYANVPYVQKYRHSFKIAGGVNQPKILDSILSNGSSFRELV
jgi:serine-protein kinase ATM